MATVRLHLDRSGDHVYTNLDMLTGSVILNLISEETISLISVKMEGLAVTRLLAPRRPDRNEKSAAETEVHKILYQTTNVFPQTEAALQSKGAGFTLRPGQYEYPFSFRIPINNNCVPNTGILTKINAANNPFAEAVGEQLRHVRTTLPPSLSGIPGDEASIRYFLKVTVTRPRFYQINLRKIQFFLFLPIEPPRPPRTTQENFARREHQFVVAPAPLLKKRSLFSRSLTNETDVNTIIPRIRIEARLPTPPIITPDQPLPLRLLFQKLTPFPAPIVIKSLQIRLLGTTVVRTKRFAKDVVTPRHVYSNLALRVIIGNQETSTTKEMEADAAIWHAWKLPNDVQPSFSTCNITRYYNMEILVGVSLGVQGGVHIIPLYMPAEVYSGIAPPPQLLQQAVHPAENSAQQRPTQTQRPPPLNSEKLKAPLPVTTSSSAPNTPSEPHFQNHAIRPVTPTTSSNAGISAPSPQTYQTVHELPPEESPAYPASVNGFDVEAPPTYDEATAINIPPVDGPRRHYEQGPGYYNAHEEVDR